jgi:hypothetical protein
LVFSIRKTIKAMIVYNVTVAVDKTIEEDWLRWMKTVHIPDVLRSGKFLDHKIYRVLAHETETTSYAVQYFIQSMDELQYYLTHHAPSLRHEVQQKFGDRQVAFRTLLEEVI